MTATPSNPVQICQPKNDALDFLNSIEGAGYGGMASFEIARMHVMEMEAALQECGAEFSTKPGSVAQCQTEIDKEFQRRMDIANAVLQPKGAAV